MKFRKRMSSRGSKRLFSRTASRTNKHNLLNTRPMRGGIRF